MSLAEGGRGSENCHSAMTNICLSVRGEGYEISIFPSDILLEWLLDDNDSRPSVLFYVYGP